MSGLRALPGRPSYTALEQHYAHQLEMARTSSAGLVEVPPTPEGYALRQFCPGDEIRYDDLFHLAFEDADRYSEIRERALEQGFFVVEHTASGDLVASCVALRGSSSPRHPEAGQLGWLVTDPSHVGKGLDSIVSVSALALHEDDLVGVWFSGVEDKAVVQAAFSTDAGKTFGNSTTIDAPGGEARPLGGRRSHCLIQVMQWSSGFDGRTINHSSLSRTCIRTKARSIPE
jgi:hypothetical protein